MATGQKSAKRSPVIAKYILSSSLWLTNAASINMNQEYIISPKFDG